MKAVLLRGYGGVDQLDYTDVPTPEPGEGQVLIRVISSSINPVDYKLREGALKQMMPLDLPAILGRDAAGEVASIGKGVSRLKPGDQVLGLVHASYADFLVADENVFARIPDGLDADEAGILPLVVLTGAQLVENGVQPRAGETVLVTGAAGSVGRTAAFVLKQHGARVIAGVRQTQLADAKSSVTADSVVAIDTAEGIESLPELDAVADTIDGPTAAKLVSKLKKSARFASVLGKPDAVVNAGIEARPVWAQPDAVRLAQLAHDYRDGKLKIPIARSYRLSEIREAQAFAEKGADGKVAIIP